MNLAATNEMPTITTTASNSCYYGMGESGLYQWAPIADTAIRGITFGDQFGGNTMQPFAVPPQQQQPQQITKEPMPKSNKRVVQIFIADPNESIPLDHALVFQDKAPHFTDLTDQELFFEIDLKGILDSHNDYRKTVVDKEASEGKAKDVMLEPAKIRDLKMVVVEVAKF